MSRSVGDVVAAEIHQVYVPTYIPSCLCNWPVDFRSCKFKVFLSIFFIFLFFLFFFVLFLFFSIITRIHRSRGDERGQPICADKLLMINLNPTAQREIRIPQEILFSLYSTICS